MVFDLDGTLVDASRLHSRILKEVMGADVPPEKVYLSSSLNFLVMKNLPRGKWDSIKDVTRRHEAAMLEHVDLAEPMPGVYKMLKAIPYRKALLTSANRRLTEAMVKHCYLHGYFDMVVTDDDVSRSKPDSEGLFLISDEFNDDKLVVVGNSERDLLAAKKFGAPFIHFKGGGPSLPTSDYEAGSLDEIPSLVESLA